jgi:hypothetical protein
MDLVKWLQKQKKHRHREHSGDVASDDIDDVDDVTRKGRQYRSHSVDPTSGHYLSTPNVSRNLAHHHSGMKSFS